jgi:hypothetical protein
MPPRHDIFSRQALLLFFDIAMTAATPPITIRFRHYYFPPFSTLMPLMLMPLLYFIAA